MVFRAFSLGFSWATLDCPWLGSPQAQLKSKLCLHSIRWSSRNVLVPGRSLTLLPNFGADHFWDWIFEMSSVTLGSQIQIRSVGIPKLRAPRDLILTENFATFLIQAFASLSRQNWHVRGSFLNCFSFSDNIRDGTLKGSFNLKKKTYENTTFLHQANKSLRQKV